MAAVVEQNVLRLDVAMHHARAVCGSKAIQRFADDTQRFTNAERALLVHLVAQIHAVNILHDEVVKTVEFAGVIHLHDMRVGDGGRGACLAVEPLHELVTVRPLSQLRMHDFDGDRAPQALVYRLVHRGHAAIGDSADDPIPAFDDLTFGGIWSFTHG